MQHSACFSLLSCLAPWWRGGRSVVTKDSCFHNGTRPPMGTVCVYMCLSSGARHTSSVVRSASTRSSCSSSMMLSLAASSSSSASQKNSMSSSYLRVWQYHTHTSS